MIYDTTVWKIYMSKVDSGAHTYNHFFKPLGSLAKGNCSKIFAERGCSFCMRIFDSPVSLCEHLEICCLPAPFPIVS